VVPVVLVLLVLRSIDSGGIRVEELELELER
jgi:hypothetical protein